MGWRRRKASAARFSPICWLRSNGARFAERISASGKLLVEVVNEHISESVALAKRPEAGKLLAPDTGLQRGDHLYLAKLDRAFRSSRDCHNTLAELKERGMSTSVCDLPNGEDVTGNGIATLLLGIMASVAEWERERIRETHRRSKAAGEGTGTISRRSHTVGKQTVKRNGMVVKLVGDQAKSARREENPGMARSGRFAARHRGARRTVGLCDFYRCHPPIER
jgi:DNA invertase Pin-like site-specific DNA recombinase